MEKHLISGQTFRNKELENDLLCFFSEYPDFIKCAIENLSFRRAAAVDNKDDYIYLNMITFIQVNWTYVYFYILSGKV